MERMKQFFCFMIVGVITSIMLAFVMQFSSDPVVAAGLASVSPWLAGHLHIIQWVSFGLILLGCALCAGAMWYGDTAVTAEHRGSD